MIEVKFPMDWVYSSVTNEFAREVGGVYNGNRNGETTWQFKQPMRSEFFELLICSEGAILAVVDGATQYSTHLCNVTSQKHFLDLCRSLSIPLKESKDEHEARLA